MARKKQEKARKLNRRGLELFHTRWRHEIKLTKFAKFYRETDSAAIERRWRQVGEGKAAPAALFHKLCEFLSTETAATAGLGCTVEEISEETDDPIPSIYEGNVLKRLWPTLKRWVSKPFESSPLCEARDEDDVRLATMWTMRWFGHYSPPEGDPLTVAEGIMHRTLDDWTKQVVEFWRKQPHCVRFVVHKRKRVGASLIFPVTEDAYLGVRNEEIYDAELLPEHIAPVTKHIILIGPVENIDETIDREVMEGAIAMTLAHQVALMTDASEWRVAIGDQNTKERELVNYLGIGATEESIRRLEGAGLVRTGTFMPVRANASAEPDDHQPIYEFSYRITKGKKRPRRTYRIMCGVVMMFRIAIFLNDTFGPEEDEDDE